MKQYADQRRRTKDTVIRVGDTVLLHQKKQTKFSTKFDPNPFKVTCKKSTMVTAIRNGKYVTRNAFLFKNVHSGFCEWEEESDEDDPSEDFWTDPEPHGNHSPNNDQNNSRMESVVEGILCEKGSN